MIKLEDLDRLIIESVAASLQETYGDLLESHSEQDLQDKASEEIDDLKLRASKNKKSEKKDTKEKEEPVVGTVPANEPANASMDEEEEVEIKASVKDDTGEPEVKVSKALPQTLNPQDMIKMLNTIRAGQSLKDPEVLKRFKAYFGSMSGPEKIALKGYLDGLAQVITGGTPGSEARDPSNPPYNVEMEAEPVRKDAKVEKSVTVKSKAKERVVKNKTPSPSGTDAPIIVGEVADKTMILKYLQLIS